MACLLLQSSVHIIAFKPLICYKPLLLQMVFFDEEVSTHQVNDIKLFSNPYL